MTVLLTFASLSLNGSAEMFAPSTSELLSFATPQFELWVFASPSDFELSLVAQQLIHSMPAESLTSHSNGLTRRPTILLCPRSLDIWWVTATVRLCCNSAGHSNRDSTTLLALTKEKPSQQHSLVQITSSIPATQNPVEPDSHVV